MDEPRTLVVLFLRGGLDGVNAVVPHFEDAYHAARPGLRLAAPRAGSSPDGLLPLDDRFALNRGLAALLPVYRDGRLAVVNAVGSDDPTRSHFEAQDQMEHGASAANPLSGGWIARWLLEEGAGQPFSALAFGRAVPESLRGAPSACSLESVEDLAVVSRTGDEEGFAAALRDLHGDAPSAYDAPAAPPVRKAARDALALLGRVQEIRRDQGTGGVFPRTDLGSSLSQVALLVRSEVGLRVATVDHGGFDTHFGQALTLEGRLREFGDALAAFDRALGPLADRVTTVCLTEFGRRIAENASLGTDHGRASCAFVLGGGVRGGRIVGKWPGLADDELEGPGDLRVTTDYRDLLAEILTRRFAVSSCARVFPGHGGAGVGVMS